jgi:hypothetical protein
LLHISHFYSDEETEIDTDNELLDVFDGDTFCRVGDLPQYSMDVLDALFEDFDKCRKVDIYCRRMPMTDPQGRRLGGTDPYAHDRHNVPKHHAHAKAQLEDCKADWVCLAGLHVKDWFEALWGSLEGKQGKRFMIGGRRVSFIQSTSHSLHSY